ncbi:DUF4258 domain-containing protein [Capnocytophaga sp.]|uniref:DUF4258 domain-containing protein n=1 Tax=Capnocytophaga sp. TaxID=44737 RepID=UPI0026DD5AB9|nr:DUF4258 domain-containing protein [Capnocytophaga sp.]MDO5105560.1 DUF4258 domain-containing protein [Capnocytophaga sp.]
MSILQRIGYYAIGLSLGIVIVAFFFKKKGTDEFCYFPNCRVLKDLRSKNVEISSNVLVSEEELAVIFTQGDVLFSKSDVNASPCKKYVIEGELQGKKVEITVENCTDKVIVTSLK